MKPLTLAAILIVGLTTPAGADFQDGVAAFDRGDYEVALREWKPLAEQGHSEAQTQLGFIYNEGLGSPRIMPRRSSGFARPLSRETPRQ